MYNKIDQIQIIKHKNTRTKNKLKQLNYPGLVASYDIRPEKEWACLKGKDKEVNKKGKISNRKT